jgi:hypothetical protein
MKHVLLGVLRTLVEARWPKPSQTTTEKENSPHQAPVDAGRQSKKLLFMLDDRWEYPLHG